MAIGIGQPLIPSWLRAYAAGREKSNHGIRGNRLRRTRKAIGENTLRTSIGPSSLYNVGGLSVPGPKGDFSNCLPCPAKRVSVCSVVKNSDTPKTNNIISQKHSKLDQLDKGCQSSFPFHPYSHYAPKLYGPRKLGAYLGSYEYI